MTGLAQKHEPFWLQILVVRDELVVHIQVLHTRVVLTAEVARLVMGREHVLPEQHPSRSQSERLVFGLQFFKIIFSFHTYQ